MKRSILFLLGGAMAMLTLRSNSNLPSNSPSIGNRTGILGANTGNCADAGCHNNQGTGGFNLSIRISKPDNTLVTQYNADSVYKITIEANASSEPGTFPKFGLQFSAKTQNGGIAGSFIPSGGLVENFSGGYPVIEQVQPLNATAPKALVKEFYWVAPQNPNSNSVTFYATVLAADDDGTPNGDLYQNQLRTINEQIVASVTDLSTKWGLTLGPNPCHDHLTIRFSKSNASGIRANLFALTGQSVWSDAKAHVEAGTLWTVPTNQLPAGSYLLYLEDDAGSRTMQHVVKQ